MVSAVGIRFQPEAVFAYAEMMGGKEPRAVSRNGLPCRALVDETFFLLYYRRIVVVCGGTMVIFDLREEARLVSFLYLVGGGAVSFGLLALAPRWLLKRLSETLADAARPLAVFFAIISAIMVWLEYDERQQAKALVAQCMSGACDMTEGPVYDVVPVHQLAAGSRYLMPTWRGHFSVGERHFTHYSRSGSSYKPG